MTASTAPAEQLEDAAERLRIADDTRTTLFVEAGAGSGKTSALVGRIMALVTSGQAELREIAAITFTEKAGAELRDRVRTALEQRRRDPSVSDVERQRCDDAVEQLDGAAIGTLHAFAQRLLSEHPVEAGLPPRVEVLDEISSGVEFEQRWARFRDALYERPDAERSLLLMVAAGVNRRALDVLAATFEQNWDLVEERVPALAPDPPALASLIDAPLAQLDAAISEREHCPNDENKLVVRLGEFEEYAGRLRRALAIDEYDAIEVLEDLAAATPKPSYRVGKCGKATEWPTDYPIADLRDAVRSAGERLADVRREVAIAAVEQLGSMMRQFTLDSARERRIEGRLAFHDLLVLARALLTDPQHGAAVRARLHERYTHLLLDEFQDTDPIQIELAVRIAALHPESTDAGAAPWDEVPLAPGQLFVVGDPKQSIYRFRRADLAVFLAARERLRADGALLQLRTNFRSVRPIVDWVNNTFDVMMNERRSDDVPADVTPQADYVRLDALRPGAPVGPAVSVVGRAAHPPKTRADDLRVAEAADIAAAITAIISDEWRIGVGPASDDQWRPARLGDITVLVPARTSVPFLQDALDDVGIPYRAETSSLVYATRAVRDLMMVVRAIADPTNELHVVSALRTPLFGCGDDDLARHRLERQGRFNYLAPFGTDDRSAGEFAPPIRPSIDDPVLGGLAWLAATHRSRQWMSPSELLEHIVRERRVLELGVVDGRPRDVWRRVRFVVEHARAWVDATGGGLRRYLAWIDLQSAEGARVAEAILPETDDDAVRIMTIHAAKGLEFPITILSGMSTVPRGAPAPAEVVFPTGTGTPIYRVGKGVRSLDYEAWRPLDEQMAFDERVRLLYVAATRAKDHLVISLHRKEKSASSKEGPASRTNADLLVASMGDRLDEVPDAVPTLAAAERADRAPSEEPARSRRLALAPEPPSAPPPFAEWRAQTEQALTSASTPSAVSATTLSDDSTRDRGRVTGDDQTAGLLKRPRDLDLPPWMKGRYGTAVGRAVHATLQTIDLTRPTDDPLLDATLAASCEAEAVTDRLDVVRGLVVDALASPSVRAASVAPHWREIHVSAEVEGRVLEGYIDLLYRSDEGLVVVDYKTAATDDPTELDRRVEGYGMQGASYALLAAATTGEPVADVRFVFLTPAGAVERSLDDLERRVALVDAVVGNGTEVLADGLDEPAATTRPEEPSGPA